MAHLRLVPIRVQSYLDDILIQSSSLQQAQKDLQTTTHLLEDHGFSINWDKSQLIPTTTLQHLGAVIDTSSCTVSLSQERIDKILSQISQLKSNPRASIVSLSQLLGSMISCINIVPWARLHTRPLQWFLLPFQRARQSNAKFKARVSSEVLQSLRGWSSQTLNTGSDFKEPTRTVITTDASLFGWGAHLDSHMTQGRWSSYELQHNINWLELRAVHLALKHFKPLIAHLDILVMTDNITVKAHINRQGGTQSSALMKESCTLCLWAEHHLNSLKAQHISGVQNICADWLSRTTIDHSEWQIHEDLFHDICKRFGRPLVDLFATPANTQLPRFFSRFRTRGAEGTDALRSSWPTGLLYAFPPLPILPGLISKIIQEKADIIVVAPYWPRRAWFADLVRLSTYKPWRIPPNKMRLHQGRLTHPDPAWLQLAAWKLNGNL